MLYNNTMIMKKRSYELDDNQDLFNRINNAMPKNPNNKKYAFCDPVYTKDKVWRKERRDKWQADAKKSRLKILEAHKKMI